MPVRNVSTRAGTDSAPDDCCGSGNVGNYDPANVIMLTGRASIVWSA